MTDFHTNLRGSGGDNGFIHVDVERLDTLLNLVGELVINRAAFAETAKAARMRHGFKDCVLDLNETVEQLGRLVESIQDKVIESRMVPVGRLFSRFEPMLKDLSTRREKPVRLELIGQDTEVDKKLIDGLSEPLIHLVRNAFDHGIEPADERRIAKKYATGTITLKAFQESNRLKVLVCDDGRGLQRDRIGRSAIEKGLITSEAFDAMSDEEVFALIFVAGFSTGAAVSELSGRGVGMDAAQRRVEGLGGRISVSSKAGEGTICAISVPLSMAIIPGLFIGVSAETMVLPVDCVEETVLVGQTDLSTVEHEEVFHLRGQTLPVLRLGTHLNVPGSQVCDARYGVIIRTQDSRLCLLVDRLMGRQEIVIKPLPKQLSGIRAVAGATILGDGSVVVILDPDGLAQSCESTGRQRHA